MWIALGILAFVATLITVILLLPVKVIIKNDEQNDLILRYKFLGKTYGEDPDPNDPIIKALKQASGFDRLQKTASQTNIQTEGLQKSLSESYDILKDFLKELVVLLKQATVTRLHIMIRCTGDGADQAAIHYGQCCAATYGLLNILQNFLKIRKKGCKIDIGCDFFGNKPVFRYETVLVVRAGRVLAALWRTVLAEAKRMAEQENQQK